MADLTVDVFVPVDGRAGSDGLPGHVGHLGPELADWITTEGRSPQIVVLGRRTHEVLARAAGGVPRRGPGASRPVGRARVLPHAHVRRLVEHADRRR